MNLFLFVRQIKLEYNLIVATETNQKESSIVNSKTLYQDFSLENHLKLSWINLKNNFVNLLIISGVNFLLNVSVVIVYLFAILLPSLVFLPNLIEYVNKFSPDFAEVMNMVPVWYWILLLSVTILWILFSLLINYSYVYAQLKILYEQSSDSIIQIYTKGFKKSPKLILYSIVSSILIIGGYFLFFLPGLVISFLIFFGIYELVTQNKSVSSAIKSSYNLVLADIPTFIVRIIILFGISFFLNIVDVMSSFIVNLLSLFGETGEIYSLIIAIPLAIFMMFIYVIFGWFATSYYIQIYKYLKDKQKLLNIQEKNLTWAWIVSLAGWLLAIFTTLITIFVVIPNLKPLFTENKENNKISSDYKNDCKYITTNEPKFKYISNICFNDKDYLQIANNMKSFNTAKFKFDTYSNLLETCGIAYNSGQQYPNECLYYQELQVQANQQMNLYEEKIIQIVDKQYRQFN